MTIDELMNKLCATGLKNIKTEYNDTKTAVKITTPNGEVIVEEVDVNTYTEAERLARKRLLLG